MPGEGRFDLGRGRLEKWRRVSSSPEEQSAQPRVEVNDLSNRARSAFEVYYDMKTLWPAASLERLEAILAPADSDA